jgi:hypothetical protein
MTTAYHPEADGQTERQNHVIEQYIRCFCDFRQNDWAPLLSTCEFSLNNSVKESTRVSPFFFELGRHPRITPNVSGPLKYPSLEEMFEARSQAQEEAKASMLMAQEHMKWYFDQNHSKVPFKVGDKVWIKGKDIKLHLKKPLTDKLAAKQHGPFEILEQYDDVTFRVKLLKRYEGRHPVFHAQKLILHHEDLIGKREPRKPGPVEFDDKDEPYYEVEKIVDLRIVEDDEGKQHVEFQVKWEGYPNEENRWVELWELKGMSKLVKEFSKNNPNAPFPKSIRDDTPRTSKKRRD